MSNKWLNKCSYWKQKWNTYKLQSDDSDGVNFYSIIESLNKNLQKDDVLITDAGTAFYIIGQAAKIPNGVRLVLPGAQADMGFSLPGSVGVSMAGDNYNPIIVTGDGSFQTNLQELATIKAHKLRTKIVIINNYGYLSIRNTQSKYYNNNIHGSTLDTGLWFPDLANVAMTYGIQYCRIENNEQMIESFKDLLHSGDCVLFDVQCKFSQEVFPSVSLKTMPDNTVKQCGLDDMAPFLSEKEYNFEIEIR